MPELGHEADRRDAASRKRWKSLVIWAVVLVAIVATIVVGACAGKSSFVVVSVLVAVYTMVPFFAQFERRRPQARELVVLAVMIALAVASRAAFAFVPFFKPMAAIVMVTGIALGASSGFLAGSIGMLVSNFFFGQGPWTPFQMLSFGLCGLVFGWLAERGIIKQGGWSMKHRVLVSLGGFVFMVLIAGPMLDTSSVFWMMSVVKPETLLAVYAAGLPANIMQGAATFVVLFAVGNPLLDKLSRVKTKYGMMA